MFLKPVSRSALFAFALSFLHIQLVAVNQTAPVGSITEQTPCFTWEQDPTANGYLLWIYKGDGSETIYRQWIDSDTVTTNGVCNWVTDVIFSQGESYSWWVKPRNEDGVGDWSSGLEFRVISDYDATPTIRGVFTDEVCKHLLIDGHNFGESPIVYLDQFPLTLSECTDDYLIADLPEGLSPGNFRLKVLRMPEISSEGEILTDLQSEEMDFTIGATGPQGPQGLQGETGPRGAKGDTGAIGPQGSQGPKGDKGAKGDTGPQGPKGVKGDIGPAGSVGPQGDKGDTGDPGLAWRGVWAAGTPYTINDAVVYNGSAYISISESNTGNAPDASPAQWELLARKGDTGEQGIQGIQGIQGDKGDKGDPGDKGDQGDKGDKGDTGDTGPAGADGVDGADGSDANLSGIKLAFAQGSATLPGSAVNYVVRKDLTAMTDFSPNPNSVNIIGIVDVLVTWNSDGSGEVIHGWGTTSNRACATMTNPSSSARTVYVMAYYLYYDK